MKIKITMKDPDGVSEAIDEAVKAEISRRLKPPVDGAEAEALEPTIQAKIGKAIYPWVEYAEYVTIEIDTTTGAAKVLKVKR